MKLFQYRNRWSKVTAYLFIFIWLSALHSTINSGLTHWFIARLEFDVRSKQFFSLFLFISVYGGRPCLLLWVDIRYGQSMMKYFLGIVHTATPLISEYICFSFRSILTASYIFVVHKPFHFEASYFRGRNTSYHKQDRGNWEHLVNEIRTFVTLMKTNISMLAVNAKNHISTCVCFVHYIIFVRYIRFASTLFRRLHKNVSVSLCLCVCVWS